MRKIIRRSIIVVLIGAVGWNTYSLHQLKGQIKKQDATRSPERNYEDYKSIENEDYGIEREEYNPIEREKNRKNIKKTEGYLLLLGK